MLHGLLSFWKREAVMFNKSISTIAVRKLYWLIYAAKNRGLLIMALACLQITAAGPGGRVKVVKHGF